MISAAARIALATEPVAVVQQVQHHLVRRFAQ
jgi:hypothetical protein